MSGVTGRWACSFKIRASCSRSTLSWCPAAGPRLPVSGGLQRHNNNNNNNNNNNSNSNNNRQLELSHCASLSTQHVRLLGVRLCRPDSLELAV